jgi:excisionase family DNA binding protein
MEALKSIEEAAEILGISPWTVRAYVRQGKIRPVRIGRRCLIEQSTLEDLVEQARDYTVRPIRRGGRQ